MSPSARLAGLLSTGALLLCAAAAPAHAAGVRHLHFRFGPLHIAPGQNSIKFAPNSERPKVAGYITKFVPNLRYADGRVPRVDVLHLHHGVWLVNLQPVFAVGEEKTHVLLPRGYGYPSDPSDRWVMNYMIHNLTPNPATVYITYDVDFVPRSDPAAQRIRPVHTLWMDVERGKVYPVFDVHRGTGSGGTFTFPNDDPNAYADTSGPRNEFRAPQDMTLVYTAGHLHPGGLHTDLTVTRDGRTVNVFRSRAHYWEPAGAVSWDVAMTVTRPDWRVSIRKGDVLRVSATYDSGRASWYESMGIMPTAYADGLHGRDPFSQAIDRRGILTHGPLPENRNHGGDALGLPDPSTLSAAPAPGNTVAIRNFVYGQGDLSGVGAAELPPAVTAGEVLTFVNRDSGQDVYHTITACRAPCNRSTGIAYPLANGAGDFDSGELGFGPSFATPTAERDTWQTPGDLQPGTYTYFCRIHPFMRGSFRVVASPG